MIPTNRGKEQYQRYRCSRGVHSWSSWGPFYAVQPDYRDFWIPSGPPEYIELEAYRWRQCVVCGSSERESYQGERIGFNPHGEKELT